MRACSGCGSQKTKCERAAGADRGAIRVPGGGSRRKKTTLERVVMVTLRDSHYSEPSERAAGADRRAIRVPGEDPGIKKRRWKASQW